MTGLGWYDARLMNGAAVTLDVDWAPDAAIDFTRELLVERRVKATWFVTHASPAIDRLRDHAELFELGIHPNFAAGSTHGTTTEEVVAHCMRLVPDAISMRTHLLIQSTPIFDVLLRSTPIRVDASLLLPHARWVEPVEYQWKGTTLLRVPYVWEDDVEMLRDRPSWSACDELNAKGLRVFDFHPVHVFLNSADMRPYTELKSAVTPLDRATRAVMSPFVHEGEGSRSAFVGVLDALAKSGSDLTMRDIQRDWSGK